MDRLVLEDATGNELTLDLSFDDSKELSIAVTDGGVNGQSVYLKSSQAVRLCAVLDDVLRRHGYR